MTLGRDEICNPVEFPACGPIPPATHYRMGDDVQTLAGSFNRDGGSRNPSGDMVCVDYGGRDCVRIAEGERIIIMQKVFRPQGVC